MGGTAPPRGSQSFPALHYAAVHTVPDDVLNLETHTVRSAGGDELGEIDGFLIDSTSGEARYVVVHSGGRVRARRYVLPVEYTRFDVGRKSLRADVDTDVISAFPQIPDEQIENLRSDELSRYHAEVRHACCPDDEDLRQFELERRAHGSPAWWNSTAWPSPAPPSEDRFVSGGPTSPSGLRQTGDRPLRSVAADEERVSSVRPPRPQPGDVIGIEGASETTLGDTPEGDDRSGEPTDRTAHLHSVDDNEPP